MKRLVNTFLSLTVIVLQWDATSEPQHRVYARASTQAEFNNITTVGAVNTAQVKVDGRRNWYFYVTAKMNELESGPSNIVYVPRGH
jgi:hypothetical protein